MRAGIFTSRQLKPLHPRLGSMTKFLGDNGLPYEIVPSVRHSILSRINWISLFFFDNYSVCRLRNKISAFDTIIIHDMKLLPLARAARAEGKVVIYETLDNNVSLRLYQLEKRFPFFKFFHNHILEHFTGKEKNIVSNYCDKVIVNSKALEEYFGPGAVIAYYYSSFEDLAVFNNPSLPPALIYLGDFSSEKGADQVLALRERLSVPLHIYGSISSPGILELIKKSPLISYTPRLSHVELRSELERLMGCNFLVGTSFIKSIHYSYATQEANKDIDYLAMGIPLVGNHRKPTGEKIMAGCGVFHDDAQGLDRLVRDEEYRKLVSGNCRMYYSANYSWEHYRNSLERVFLHGNK
ncbi:MAG: hypothetical protein U0X39_15580 [Bacteroidales bacterium]